MSSMLDSTIETDKGKVNLNKLGCDRKKDDQFKC
jgi:hypothetical protein